MRLNTIEFLLQQSWESMVRNGLVSLASVGNIAVALTVLGGIVLTGLNLEHMAAIQAETAVITVDLEDGADAADVQAALLRNQKVKEAIFVPKDDALLQMSEQIGWVLPETKPELAADLLAGLLGHNPLPDSVRVKTIDPQDIPAMAAQAQKIAGVAEVRYGEQVTEKLLTLARGTKISGLVIGLIMGAATLLIISTTIRLTIYARRREIRIMQLVGATNWFIRLPFVLEGLLQGLTGAVIAIAVLLPAYSYAQGYIDKNLEFISLIYSPGALALFALGLAASGIVFGALGSAISLRRYLRVV